MAEEVQIKIDVRTAEGKQKLKDLQSGVKDVGDETKKSSGEMGAFGSVADKASGGAVTAFKGLGAVVKGSIKQFGVLRLAVAATGIGALVLAVTAVGKAFTSSEEGQNKFAKIMAVIGALTGNLTTLLSDLGEKIIWVFENPKEALNEFVDLVKTNLINRFEGFLELIPQLGKAINLLFKGQFSEAGKVAGNAVAKVALGIDDMSGKIQNAIDKTKEFVNEQINEAKIAGDIADKRALADKKERDLLVERAEANRKIAELRNIAADKDNVQAAERIKALEEAGRISDEITAKEIAAAKLRFDAKVAENALANSTKEDLLEEAQLKANLINLETARLSQQKALISAVTGAKREEAAELKRIEDEKIAADKLAQDEKDKAETERLKKEEEAKKVKLEKDKIIAAEEIALEQQVTSAKLNALDALIGFADKESALGKAAFIAKQVMAAKEMLMTAKDTLGKISLKSAEASVSTATGAAETAKIGFPQNIPFLIGYAAQAVGIISAIKSAVGASKGAIGKSGAGGSIPSIQAPSIAASSPSFNIVGQGGTNQLADTISGQSKQPIKAYVVSSDVTTAQSMERNIVSSASI
jgi:hypothetical protein